MTGPTHRQYSVTWAFLTAALIYEFGLSQINYYVYLVILLMTSKIGAKFPDVDHSWQNVSEKTVPNWIINKLIHLTGGRHRSWQTHSIDILVIVTAGCWYGLAYITREGIISTLDFEIVNIIVLGFLSGWWSHMISDMLNGAGVRLFCWRKKKVDLVPKKLFKLRFNTGNEWEAFCYRTTKLLNMGLGVIAVLYPILRQLI